MTTSTTRRSAEQTRLLIQAVLEAHPEGRAVATIATNLGISPTTTATHLTHLEKADRARREAGGFQGRKRLPDTWYPVTAEDTLTEEAGEAPAPDHDAERGATIEDSGSVPSHSEELDETHDADTEADTAPPTSVPDPETNDPDPEPPLTDEAENVEADADEPEATPEPDDLADTASGSGESPNGQETPPEEEWAENDAPGSHDDDAMPNSDTGTPESAPAAPGGKESESPVEPVNPVSGSKRLRPGELQAMVMEIMAASPDKQFSPTELGHTLQRSTGAIQNGLVSMVRLGKAELSQKSPRRYRIIT